MGNVKVKTRVSHLATGEITDGIEIKNVYSKGQEFICSEEEAKRLGNSVLIVERIPESHDKPEEQTEDKPGNRPRK